MSFTGINPLMGGHGYPPATVRSRFHPVTPVAMGMWLLENCDLEALRKQCARLNQYDLSSPPLR